MPLFGRIFAAWQSWENGIPPGREWRGRGGQNPRLLRAFGVISSAQAQAQAEQQGNTAGLARHAQMAADFRKQHGLK